MQRVRMIFVLALGLYGFASWVLLLDYFGFVKYLCLAFEGFSTGINFYFYLHEFLSIPIPRYSMVVFVLVSFFATLGLWGKMKEKWVYKCVGTLSSIALTVGIFLIYIMLYFLQDICWWCILMDFVLAVLLSFSILGHVQHKWDGDQYKGGS